MQNNATKESFKLLQLSDTSKSSELELPEVSIQRKRRIRRKVRTSASPHLRSYNASHKDSTDEMQSPCQNVGLWVAVFMSCGWLLILSYMMAVVYTENRRLEVEISKLSTSSQSVPEALQKWHETSKGLEQNQTSISSTLYAVQKRVDDLEKDLNIVKAALSKKDANSEENKMSLLENNVANLGAKMLDLTAELGDLKEKMKDVRAKEDVTQTLLNKLQETYNKTSVISTSNTNNDTMVAINNLRTNFSSQITSLSANLTIVTNTLTQRIAGLDVDVKKNRGDLDKTTEDVAKLTNQVSNLKPNISTMTPVSGSNKGAPNSNM